MMFRRRTRADPGGAADAELVEKLPHHRRLPVWAALSELFWDNEVQAGDHDRIAAAIRAAGVDAAQAEAILVREVAPVFVPNLLSVAGEWTGWSKADVRDAVTAHLRRGPVRRRLAAAWARAGRGLYWNDWVAVSERLRAAQAAEENDRGREPASVRDDEPHTEAADARRLGRPT